MMEIVSLCVPQIGASQLGTLVPRVVEVMKTGIGLGTKVASAQFVISLVHQCLLDLTPYAGEGYVGVVIMGVGVVLGVHRSWGWGEFFNHGGHLSRAMVSFSMVSISMVAILVVETLSKRKLHIIMLT